MKKAIYGTAMTLAVMLIITSTIAIAGTMEEGEDYSTEIVAGWTAMPPILDGAIGVNEWRDATVIDIAYTVENTTVFSNATVDLYFMNDADWLYVAIRLGYVTNDTVQVALFLGFDADLSGDFEIDSGNDVGIMVMGNSTTSMGMSFGSVAYAMAYEDYPTYEFAISIASFEDEEDIPFCVFAEIYDYNETFVYPIDFDVDFEEVETETDDWAVITLATVPDEDDEQAAQIRATNYGLIMMGVGVVMNVFLIVAYKETILRWIGDGREKILLAFMGVGVIISVLGILQIMYDWIGMII